MVTQERGLARVIAINADRSRRVRELRAQGRKAIGYLCLYPVIEMVTAAGLVPYRIFGDMREPITRADAHMAPVVCAFMRSCLDIGMKGRYDFLDGVVFAHVCDVACMIPGMWRQSIPMPYSFFIDTPHTTRGPAQQYFRGLLDDFQKSLEDFTGVKLTWDALKRAVDMHNEQRRLFRELYDLRKPDPPLISGSESLRVVMAAMSLPVDEGNRLLREVIQDVKEREPRSKGKRARLLIWGSVIDDTAFVDMVESLDAEVVMDDICTGSRAFCTDVPATDDPLDGLSQYYLLAVRCPRTFREASPGGVKKDYWADLESRFGYLREYVRDWKVNGVILQSLRYCDGHGYEVPAVKDFLEEVGVPSVYLEHNYSEAALAPMKTRVQGLTEIIG